MSFRVRGPYFESCNCEAICPCRMVGGVPGGRSTYGICYGALSWHIQTGHLDAIDLSGLNVVLVSRYDDDEPGSPWDIVLHVDAQADEEQRRALSYIFLEGIPHLPWIRKARNLIDVRSSDIVIDGAHVRVGREVLMHATRPVDTDLPVACGIPGYDRAGYELYADELTVDDEPFQWSLAGNCAFVGDFDYVSQS